MLVELYERLVSLQIIKVINFLQFLELELDSWSLIIILWDGKNQFGQEISSLPKLGFKFSIFLVKVIDLPNMTLV